MSEFKDSELGRIPSGWTVERIGNFARFRRGISYKAEDLSESSRDESIPLYINMKSFDVGGGYRVCGDKFFTSEYEAKHTVGQNDLLISNTDVTEIGAILGSPIFLPREKLKKDVLFSHHVTALTISGEIDVEYLSFALSFGSVRRNIQQLGRGTTVKMLDMKDVAQISLNIPPLPEQKKIASILTSVDDVIEKIETQIAKLQDLKTGMMNELLTNGIGHTEFKDSELGRIPADWEVKTLSEIAITKGIQTGPFGSQLHAHEYTDIGIPVIMPKDMKTPLVNTISIARISEERAASLSKHRVLEGDVLFSRRGDIGRLALMDKSNSGWVCGTGCLRARLNQRIVHPPYIAQYLTLEHPIAWLQLNAVGMTMPNISTGILKELPILISPLPEQKKIASIMTSVDDNIDEKQRKLEHTQSLKKSLMQDLLTGKVRVEAA